MGDLGKQNNVQATVENYEYNTHPRLPLFREFAVFFEDAAPFSVFSPVYLQTWDVSLGKLDESHPKCGTIGGTLQRGARVRDDKTGTPLGSSGTYLPVEGTKIGIRNI
ncbi:MAG: hypothetical protein Q4A71_03630 [Actinomycetaceae bacterium]|nr:hypothetical protein [Actinomycetaceae bacterium]